MHFFNTKHIYGVVLNTKHMCITYLNHCQWLVIGQWFSQGTPMSSNNKTDRTEIAEIMLKVVIKTITLTLSEPRRGPHYKIYVRISSSNQCVSSIKPNEYTHTSCEPWCFSHYHTYDSTYIISSNVCTFSHSNSDEIDVALTYVHLFSKIQICVQILYFKWLQGWTIYNTNSKNCNEMTYSIM